MPNRLGKVASSSPHLYIFLATAFGSGSSPILELELALEDHGPTQLVYVLCTVYTMNLSTGRREMQIGMQEDAP